MASGEKENLCPRHAKQKRLSLKLKSRKSEESSERFPLLLNEQIRETKQFSVPAKTKKSTDRALRLFESWQEQRNKQNSSEEEKVPDGLLVADSPEDLCRWLYTCVNELRKGDGSEYIPLEISASLSVDYSDT